MKKPLRITPILMLLAFMCGESALQFARAQSDISTTGDVSASLPPAAPPADTSATNATTNAQPQLEPEQFVPAAAAAELPSVSGGTIVLRPDATVSDATIRIKNICRWSEADAAFFATAADLSVAHLLGGQKYAKIGIDQLRTTLRDAGMNLAILSFGGATSCAVNRVENAVDERVDLEKWADSRQPIGSTANFAPVIQASDTNTAAGVAPAMGGASAMTDNSKPLRSLRAVLAADLCRRLNLDPATVEMAFNSSDEKVLNLAEPYFEFEVTPRRVRILNELSWDVMVVANGERHNVTINASARVWQIQTVLVKPLDYQQLIRDEDVTEKRTLTDQLPVEPLLTKSQAVGQQAARVLKPGTVLTGRMVDPTLLVRTGQLITVNVIHGSMRITAVAKALESGTYGQTIRARNDVDPTKTFEVSVTGPQEGTVTGMSAGSQDQTPSPIAAAPN